MNEPKQKIAFVYDAIFPYVTGGAEKRFFEVGKRLAAEGYDVHFYGMKSWNGADVIKENGMTLHGIMRNESLYTKQGKRSIGEAFRFGLAAWQLRKESFDVIDCCSFPYFSLFSLRLVTWIKRKPLYCTWHEVWGCGYWREYLGLMGIVGYAVERIASGLPDTIIAVSDQTAQELADKLGRKKNVVVIPNGIDLEKIAEAEAGKEKSDIIFAGRLIAHKNVDKLIAALDIVKKNFPDVMLTVVGEGPEEDRLKKLVNDLRLESNVRFSGFVEENKLFSYMKSSRMLALPSSREGFGMVVLEAKACGLPILTVDESQNASRHFMRESNGDVITENSPQSIAKGIEKILENRDPIVSSREIEEYGWSNIAIGVKEVFNLKNNI